jgi:thiol-disulfide isomerase/thioredoxin
MFALLHAQMITMSLTGVLSMQGGTLASKVKCETGRNTKYKGAIEITITGDHPMSVSVPLTIEYLTMSKEAGGSLAGIAFETLGSPRTLHQLTESFGIDGKSGDVLSIECRWNSSIENNNQESATEGRIALKLESASTLDAVALAKVEADRKTLGAGQEKLYSQKLEPEAARKLAAELETSLASGKFAAEAAELRGRVDRMIRAQAEDEAREREANKLIGRPAPEFTGKDLDGNEVVLSKLRGKVVLLSLWASWCMPCNMEMPYLDKIAERFAGKGLVVLGLNSQEGEFAERETKHFKSKKLHYPAILGMKPLAETLRVSGIPATFVIDREGVLRIREVGFDEAGIAELETKIEALLGAGSNK